MVVEHTYVMDGAFCGGRLEGLSSLPTAPFMACRALDLVFHSLFELPSRPPEAHFSSISSIATRVLLFTKHLYDVRTTLFLHGYNILNAFCSFSNSQRN
jgi:hypothetical protein